MSTQETISVIIPAYNPGPFLLEALESVQAQTRQPLETIVIDDGSEPAIAIPPRITIPVRLVRQANTGQAQARNHGISLATGSWIAFLDADDIWHPRKLEAQLALAKQHAEAAIIGCRSVLINEKSVSIGVGPGRFSGEGLPLTRENFVDAAPFAGLIPSMALVRTSIIQSRHSFDRTFQPIEDLVFFDRLLSQGHTCAMVDSALLKRRIHEDSLTLRFREMLASYLKWEGTFIKPEMGEAVARSLRSSAYLVTGLSALAKKASPAARSLLKKGFATLPGKRFLAPLCFACLSPACSALFRTIKRAFMARQAEALWRQAN